MSEVIKKAVNAWSHEQDEVLIAAVKAGKKASEVAAQMGKSRNAVLGRAFRLGFNFGVGTARDRVAAARAEVKRPKVERVGGAKALPKPKPAKVAGTTTGEFNPLFFKGERQVDKHERRQQAEETRAEMLVRMAEMAQQRPGVPFMRRRVLQCAAMYGTGMDANVCGAPVTHRANGKLSSYCADHHRLYHQASAPKPLDRVKDQNVLVLKAVEEEQEEEIVPVDAVLGDDDDAQQAA